HPGQMRNLPKACHSLVLFQPLDKIIFSVMPNELLSICIPTRNRARYLKEILAAFARQINEDGIGPDKIAFYISDNASDDETPKIISAFAQKVPRAACSRNAVNIGADGNNIHIRTLAKGNYFWVVGDDELLSDQAVVTVLRLIEKYQPGLIVAFDSRYDLRISTPQVFADYRIFAEECIRRNAHALAEHTLISSNIFRADCFDGDYAMTNLGTFFPHMFGMIRPLMKKKASVVLPATPIITVRDWRPGAVDGQWVDVGAAWRNYFVWLRDELRLPELDPAAPGEHLRRAMIKAMLKSPIRFLAGNWRSIFDPKAYRVALNRLFRKTG
ncbi:MAG: glycosyltransferase family 2 protein, partial [Limisphaerales bacterium]